MKTDDVLTSSEQYVIGSILIDNDSFDRIDLHPHEFFSESHRILYGGIVDLLGKGMPVDIITLAEFLNKNKDLEKAGELRYIGALAGNQASSANIVHHAEIVKKEHKIRAIKALSADLLNASNDRSNTPESLVEMAENGLFKLIENTSESSIDHVYQAAIEAVEFEDSDTHGVMSGLVNFDRFFNGFKNSDLIILAARPAAGKTSLAMQIAENVARTSSVVVFSLEMSKRQLASRMIKFHSSQVGKSEALGHIKSLQMHIDDRPGITVQHIRSQCRKIKRSSGLSMIVVDYLQLMQGRGDNRNQEIGSISRGLKSIAKEFDIPVLVLSQLNRKLEDRSDKRPVMSDLRESGEIEQDADMILFIYRDEIYNKNTEDEGLAEIICRKYRNGATGKIFLEFNGENTRFSDTSRKGSERSTKVVQRGFSVVSKNHF